MQVNLASHLDRQWFARHPVAVAFDLVGSLIVVVRDGVRVAARIVETEAYGGLEDLASHATMYRLGRATLENDAGVLYMQRSYGLHTMTNIVSHEPGGLGAVLLRAAEDPIEGLDIVLERRAPRVTNLLVGPGNLSRGIGTRLSDTLLAVGHEAGVYLLPQPAPPVVKAGPRIGITRSADAPWRFFDGDSARVSSHRRGDAVTQFDIPALISQLPGREP